MAVLKLHKSTIAGLPADLANLASQISTEANARVQAVSTLQAALETEVSARMSAVNSINNTLMTHNVAIETLENHLATVMGDASVSGSIAKSLFDAKAYTDAKEFSITNAYQSYADQAELDAVSTSKAYTDARESALTTAYKAYADQVELSSKAYTDARESALTTAYRAYADQAKLDAVSTSKFYTDARETTITAAYQSYADQAELDAVSTSKAYTDTRESVINSVVATKLTASNNFSDITDVAAARANLGIYSAVEVDTAINDAILSLGTNYSVPDAAGKNALTKLTVGDNIFVSNDGDGNWALYKVIGVTDGNGSTSTFEKIMDKEVYLNAISAESVKAAYESNPNTNAFTDAEKAQIVTNTSDLAVLKGDASTVGSFKNADATTLAEAKSYTDAREAAITAAYTSSAGNAETTSKAYTDARESALTTAYKAYADQAELDAVATSKSYTDAREAAITSAYQSAITTASADANAYTDAREAASTLASKSYTDAREAAIVSSLTTSLTTEVASLNSTISTKLAKSANLSDLSNVAVARTNLGVYSKEEIDSSVNAVSSASLKYKDEIVVVNGDLIVLSHAPIGASILNHNYVRYTDLDDVSADIPVSVTNTAGGKEFLLKADIPGQFNGLGVSVQYLYV